jgi:hypothetical protein
VQYGITVDALQHAGYHPDHVVLLGNYLVGVVEAEDDIRVGREPEIHDHRVPVQRLVLARLDRHVIKKAEPDSRDLLLEIVIRIDQPRVLQDRDQVPCH